MALQPNLHFAPRVLGALFALLTVAASPAPSPPASAPAAPRVAPAVSQPWSRATPPGATTAAGFLTIDNAGPADTLVAVRSARAGRAEIHRMSMDGGVMSMRALPDGVAIPAAGQVVLAPGGLHLMFFELSKPLVEGEKVPVTLQFAKAGAIEIELVVRPIGARGP